MEGLFAASRSGNGMILHLPWPPSVNAMWRMANGKWLLSKAGRQYRTDAWASILMQGKPDKITGRLAILIDAFPPDKRARDLDNLFKGVLDALQHCEVIENDSHVDELSIRRGEITPNGSLMVDIRGIS